MCLKGDSRTKNNTKITELFYQQSFLNNKLIADFSKLNFGTYLAGNEYASRFITDFFLLPTKQLILIHQLLH
ncbi:hypothetical protein ATZ36_16655 [Candidatus Endomicrobiellum trichonymphae]|uniref:Uncharacterized protein n=1 Tax=Endomicrobium trichonymphae TaxID=1408204 RepID=A0A1E5IJD7_ENDTX|nr:hypothetical protein ATZ36_16655 [Candidatus Endomicrobium trichonymphae]